MNPVALSLVPAEPIRRELKAYLDRGFGNMTPTPRENRTFAGHADVALLIWPQKSRKSARQRLESLIYKQKYVTYDLAERILIAIGREHLWYADPVLAEAYQRVVLTDREEAA